MIFTSKKKGELIVLLKSCGEYTIEMIETRRNFYQNNILPMRMASSKLEVSIGNRRCF
jgi:hypothetical protein